MTGAKDKRFVFQCEHCWGTGEIVTDWDRYYRLREGDKGDEVVADCPECEGNGAIEVDNMRLPE